MTRPASNEIDVFIWNAASMVLRASEAEQRSPTAAARDLIVQTGILDAGPTLEVPVPHT